MNHTLTMPPPHEYSFLYLRRERKKKGVRRDGDVVGVVVALGVVRRDGQL